MIILITKSHGPSSMAPIVEIPELNSTGNKLKKNKQKIKS